MIETLQQYLESASIREEDEGRYQVIDFPALGKVESAAIELTQAGDLDEIGKSIAWIQVQRIKNELAAGEEMTEHQVVSKIKSIITGKLIR